MQRLKCKSCSSTTHKLAISGISQLLRPNYERLSAGIPPLSCYFTWFLLHVRPRQSSDALNLDAIHLPGSQSLTSGVSTGWSHLPLQWRPTAASILTICRACYCSYLHLFIIYLLACVNYTWYFFSCHCLDRNRQSKNICLLMKKQNRRIFMACSGNLH